MSPSRIIVWKRWCNSLTYVQYLTELNVHQQVYPKQLRITFVWISVALTSKKVLTKEENIGGFHSHQIRNKEHLSKNRVSPEPGYAIRVISYGLEWSNDLEQTSVQHLPGWPHKCQFCFVVDSIIVGLGTDMFGNVWSMQLCISQLR